MHPYKTKLLEIGKTLNRWKAELIITSGLAIIGSWIWTFGLVDLWLRVDRSGRLVTWVVMLGLIGALIWLVRRAFQYRYSPEGVAATVEKSFPELDNRLINVLQFSPGAQSDPFKAAYVKEGVPGWQSLDFRQMRDRKKHKRSWIALSITLALLLIPVLIFGEAWAVALWRTVNPFSNVAPPTLTKILEVQPGKSSVLIGDPLDLVCRVQGFDGHKVFLELEPDDGNSSKITLGGINGGEAQDFSHRIPKTMTGLRYRFQAGDSVPSEWYEIGVRPPPAFTSLTMMVRPPTYMNMPAYTIDPREQHLTVPVGSLVQATAEANTALEGIQLEGGAESVSLSQSNQSNLWGGTALVTYGTALVLKGTDTYGSVVEEEVRFTLQQDVGPAIELISPKGKTILPPGERPRIEFEVSDEFGISQVTIEQVTPSATPDDPGKTVKTWNVGGLDVFRIVWNSETTPDLADGNIAFRIVASDNQPEASNIAYSGNVIFAIATAEDMARKRAQLENEALLNLQKVIELQKNNLNETTNYSTVLANISNEQWETVTQTQAEVRELTRVLLANPLNPLGPISGAAKQLYLNEMLMAIDALESIPSADVARQGQLVNEAIALQSKILSQLTYAISSMGDAKIDRAVSGLSALLESLVKDQSSALKQTESFIANKAKVASTLVDAQDRISEDMSIFVNTAKTESAQVRQTDASLGRTIDTMVSRADELRIRNNMVIAAERLDDNKASEALPLEESALSGLKALLAMLDQVKLSEENEKKAEMLAAINETQDKLSKLQALNEKMQEAMDTIRGQNDKNDEAFDVMEEEYVEMQQNIEDSFLEVPNDLHVFTDLNVANDLVEDVYAIFQEIEQQETGREDPEDVKEAAFSKSDSLAEAMGEVQDRLDAMEHWLGETADETQFLTEAFDQEEMPEAGIALGELAAATEDLIGDLLEEEEEMAEAAADSATTHAEPDWENGGEVMEGDRASFGAQGKSGNERPDHKEQDGRSNVGRQGMSIGETAAGSGTISEGDENIEERRTEDPTQSGKVDLAGEADTEATGGGKLGSGKADDKGMSGGIERMDSTEEGSEEGMASLMARQADAMFAKASMNNIRINEFKNAAQQLRQADDAIAQGDITAMREFRKQAIGSLTEAQAKLAAGPTGAMQETGTTGVLDDMVQSGPDQAPSQYRDQVAEYYKALNEEL
ncbi:MAG: hypothetical protein AAFY98_01005 [Verrucomicrobiota bacterium]